MAIFPFKYITYPGDKLRPIVKVFIKYRNTEAGFHSLIDSGSDITLSYAELGMALGINFDDPKLKSLVEEKGIPFEDEISGLTGACKVYNVPTTISFGGKEIEVIVRWIRQPLNTKTDFPIVLGQDSIFELFNIYFSKRNHKFILTDEEIGNVDEILNKAI